MRRMFWWWRRRESRENREESARRAQSERRERRRSQCEALGLSWPGDELEPTLAWALSLYPEATERQAELLLGCVRALVWRCEATRLKACLADIDALDALHVLRHGVRSRSLWAHVVHHCHEELVWERLLPVLVAEGLVDSSTLEHAEHALASGARSPPVLYGATWAFILHGRLRRATRLLRRHASCPQRELLWHLATRNSPLPTADCDCSVHDAHTGRPTSIWLKPFYSIVNDIGDTDYSLCLSCHTCWCDAEDIIAYDSRWSRTPLAAFAGPNMWVSHSFSRPDPGAKVRDDPAAFIRWIRTLTRPVHGHTGV